MWYTTKILVVFTHKKRWELDPHIAHHNWWLSPTAVGICYFFGVIITLLIVSEILFFTIAA